MSTYTDILGNNVLVTLQIDVTDQDQFIEFLAPLYLHNKKTHGFRLLSFGPTKFQEIRNEELENLLTGLQQMIDNTREQLQTRGRTE